MTTAIMEPVDTPIERTRWRIDPDRSRVEFEVATLWGLMTVAGRFVSSDGTLALTCAPAIELTIDADSLDTNHSVRDEHLRSAEFFGLENHPYVRFVSDSATLSGMPTWSPLGMLRTTTKLTFAGGS